MSIVIPVIVDGKVVIIGFVVISGLIVLSVIGLAEVQDCTVDSATGSVVDS